MLRHVPPRRLLLLAAALLSACGAAGPSGQGVLSRGAGTTNGPFGAYLAGRFALSETDTDEAADRLLEALRQEPEQAEIVSRAFMAALLDGRADALRLARRLPDNQFAALVLIGSEGHAGRWDRAEQRLRALPRQGAAQFLQPLLLAWAQQGRGATDAALGTLRPLAEGGRLRGIHALHMALIADVASRPREAERWIRAAIAETPEPSLRFLQLSAGVLARAGREAEGLRLLEGLGRGGGDLALAANTEAARRATLSSRGVASPLEGMAEAYLALGAALRGQQAGELPLVLARLALRLRPGFTPALLLIADHYAEENHPDTALAVLQGVPAGDPLGRVVAMRRGSLLNSLDRVAEAEAALRQVAAEAPGAPQPLIRLGDMLRGRSRFAEAAQAYDAAVARIPTVSAGDWALLYARGIARERSGDWPRAEADFRRALELQPEQPYVLNYLAYTWVERGQHLPEARRMLERAVELRPEDGNIVDSLGWALFRLGDLPGAIRWLERAVELEPRNSVINDHLGDAYWAAGRRAEARFQWQRALTTEPEAAEVPKIEAKLRDGLREPPAATARRD
jgi:tetratricopeptide (TPR) repeat protein